MVTISLSRGCKENLKSAKGSESRGQKSILGSIAKNASPKKKNDSPNFQNFAKLSIVILIWLHDLLGLYELTDLM